MERTLASEGRGHESDGAHNASVARGPCRTVRRGRPLSKPLTCRVCGENVVDLKAYFKRHRICEVHSGPQVQFIHGEEQQWCQQCGTFHRPDAFRPGRRTCKLKLKKNLDCKQNWRRRSLLVLGMDAATSSVAEESISTAGPANSGRLEDDGRAAAAPWQPHVPGHTISGSALAAWAQLAPEIAFPSAASALSSQHVEAAQALLALLALLN